MCACNLEISFFVVFTENEADPEAETTKYGFRLHGTCVFSMADPKANPPQPGKSALLIGRHDLAAVG